MHLHSSLPSYWCCVCVCVRPNLNYVLSKWHVLFAERINQPNGLIECTQARVWTLKTKQQPLATDVWVCVWSWGVIRGLNCIDHFSNGKSYLQIGFFPLPLRTAASNRYTALRLMWQRPMQYSEKLSFTLYPIGCRVQNHNLKGERQRNRKRSHMKNCAGD